MYYSAYYLRTISLIVRLMLLDTLQEIDNDLGVVHAEQAEVGDDEHNGKKKRK